MPRPIRATVSAGALAHNLLVAKAHAGSARVWAVLKANAYGHGLERAARALEGADGYAVLDFQEAARLRVAGVAKPILMLEGFFKPGDIPLSLITHLHYDHWAGHSLFPNAEFWIQGEEVAFWTGPFGRLPAFRGSANVEALANLTTLNYGNKIRIIEGDHEVWPGLRVHKVGGHTAGLQIVSVETRRGTVVLTSDASHFYHNVETRQPVQIITSLPEMLTAFETIDRLAGSTKLVVAGHDPQVAERFKPVEPGIIKIA